MNQLFPRHLTSSPLVCAHRPIFDLSAYGTPKLKRSNGVLPFLVRWKMNSWQSLTKCRELIGLKWPTESTFSSRVWTLIDLIQLNVFWRIKSAPSSTTNSCGRSGSDDTPPMLRKKEPFGLSTRLTSVAQVTDHRK